jgi:hypothetical protein
MAMAAGPVSSSGEDPFLEVKAISRVLSSEVPPGPDWIEESFQNEGMAGQFLHSLSTPESELTRAHARHRSVQQSDSKKHLIEESPGSRPKGLTSQGSVPASAKSAKSPNNLKGNVAGFDCSCRREGDRWQQGQWSGEEWETKSFTTKKTGMCRCIAGAAADCTAVCCCPLSLLHLLALACIKLPSVVVIRNFRKAKSKFRKKQKCNEVNEDDVGPTTPFTPSLSCRESMGDVSWAPSSGFADPRVWQEYFGADAPDHVEH